MVEKNRGKKEETIIVSRGRPVTCKVCGHQFKLNTHNRESWQNGKMPCLSCNQLYCCLPETERNLRINQDLFFENNRSEKYMTEIYKILLSYTKSLILKMYSYKIESTEDLEYYAHSASSFLIEEYYKNPNFKIDISFAGFVIKKIKQAIFGKQEYSSALTKNDVSIDQEDEEGHQIYQIASERDLIGDIENKEDSVLTTEFISNLIFKIEDVCNSKEENFRRLLSIRNFLRHRKNGEMVVDKLFSSWGKKGKEMFIKTMDIVNGELRELQK